MFKKGDLVRCVRAADGRLLVDNVYVCAKDEENEFVKIVKDEKREKINWYAERFVLAEAPEPAKEEDAIIAPIPLTLQNVAVGLRVILIDEKGNGNLKGKVGQEFVVKEHGELTVSLVGLPGTRAYFKRFVLAPVIPVVEVGSRLRVIEGHRASGMRKGKTVTVAKVGKDVYYLKEHVGGFAKRRFVLVEEAVAPKPIAPPVAPPKAPRFYLPECLSLNPPKLVVPAPEAPKPQPVKPKGDLRAMLREKKQKAGYLEHTITSFAVLRGTDNEAEFLINPACYAPINYNTKPLHQFVIDTPCHEYQLKDELRTTAEAYLSFLFNESPWAGCFITKDAKEAFDKGIEMDCTKTISQVVGAAITVREAIEAKRRLPMFRQMIDKGYSGKVAYLMALSFAKAAPKETYSVLSAGAGHDAMTISMEAKEVISFFKNGFPTSKEEPANVAPQRYFIFKAVSPTSDQYGQGNVKESFLEYIQKNVKLTIVGEGWQKKESVTEVNLYLFADKLETLFKHQEK